MGWGTSVFHYGLACSSSLTGFFISMAAGFQESKKRSYQGSLRPSPRIELTQCHFHLILLIKACHKASQIQQRGNRLHFLMEGTAKSLWPF